MVYKVQKQNSCCRDYTKKARNKQTKKETKKESYRGMAWTKIDKIKREGKRKTWSEFDNNERLQLPKANASEWGEKSVFMTWRLKCEQTI